MREIQITVRDKIARKICDTVYVCGNSDYGIVFDFDDDWKDEHVKTARFSYGGTHQDVVFEGNVCAVPIISNTHNIRVGVFAGNLQTTTAAYVPAKKSILCEGSLPADPQPDVYAQIMELLNNETGGVPDGSTVLPPVTDEDEGKILTVVGGEWAASNLPKYNGAYEVTPLTNGETTLQTAQTFMDSNIVVKQIPYYQTGNTSDGDTVYIGTEV